MKVYLWLPGNASGRKVAIRGSSMLGQMKAILSCKGQIQFPVTEDGHHGELHRGPAEI